jgi:hypothetical protein
MVAPTSRSRAFFLELVVDIAIFAFCAVIALQVFVQARVSSDESAALTHLSLEAQQVAETFKVLGAGPGLATALDASTGTSAGARADVDAGAGTGVSAEVDADAGAGAKAGAGTGVGAGADAGAHLELYFDDVFLRCDESMAKYRITCSVSDSSDGVSIAHIVALVRNEATDAEDELFSLDASYYFSGGGD